MHPNAGVPKLFHATASGRDPLHKATDDATKYNNMLIIVAIFLFGCKAVLNTLTTAMNDVFERQPII